MQERLQKILSARGIASRRKAEEYITAGLVTVNGVKAILGQKADPETDRIEVDGKVLTDRAEMLYFVMNKPEGVETTNVIAHPSPVGRGDGGEGQTVRDLLPEQLQGKIFPVGRLDKDSSGLLFFTNDGVLAYRLTHPKFDHEKEYEIVTDRTIQSSACKKIEDGFIMDGSMTKPMKCWKVATNRARVILTEGKNRQVRRMFQQVGYTVKELRRVRIMSFEDAKMPAGGVRQLTLKERQDLLRSVGL